MGILKFILHAVTHAGWRLVIALLMLVAYVAMIVLRSVEMAEILGNLILLTGALLIARGVVLPKDLRA